MKVKPYLIELHLTNFCNHACTWCVAQEIRKNNWQFTMDSAKKLIKELSEENLKVLLFSGGGDPFMFKGIEELLILSHSLGITNSIITNGSRLNKDNIPIVAETCEKIRISLDAGNKKTHTLIHQPKNEKLSNFDIVINNVHDLVQEIKKRELNKEVTLTFVVVNESFDSIPEFLNIAEELKVNRVEFKTNHFWSEERKKNIYYTLKNFISEIEKKSYKITIEYPKSRKDHNINQEWNSLYLSAVIEANGDMYPCCHKSPQPIWFLGNVLNGFKKTWIGDQRKNVLKRVITEKKLCPTCLDGSFNKYVNKAVFKFGIDVFF